MKVGTETSSNASRAAWAIACGLIVIDVILAVRLGFSVPLDSFVIVVGCSALCLGLAWFYRALRPEPAFSALLAAAAFLIVFSAAAASLSYLGAGASLPLQDAAFAALDRSIGFDWVAHLEFVAARPWLIATLTAAYDSCALQLAVILLALAVRRDWARLAEFQFLVASTGATVIVLAALLPSVGAYVFHAPPGSVVAQFTDAAVGRWHLADFTALRSGAMREIPLRHAEGLVTFPSFHTALAFVFTWTLIGHRWLAAPMTVLNIVMVISTLAIGGHYLVDVLAGGAIAVAFVLLVPALRKGAAHAGVPAPASTNAVSTTP